MLWRDPLATPGDRFPLGPPAEFWTESGDEPSTVGTRPFSLRGVVAAPKADIGTGVTYVYDPERQITLVRDAHGEVVPLSKHTKPGPTPSAANEHRAVRLKDIRSVWYRHPSHFVFPEGMSRPERRHAAAEARCGVGGVHSRPG